MGNEAKLKLKGENTTGKSIGSAIGGLKRLKKVGAAVGKGIGAAFKIATVAIGALVAASGIAVRAFSIQQAAENELAAALRNGGDAVDELLPKLKDFASQLQKQTKFGDEEILTQIAFARNLGISADKLEEATKAAIGLSAKLKVDLKTAMTLVGKAATGNTASLQRYGIQIDATLEPQERFNALLKIGGNAFALAEAETDTFQGSLKQLTNIWGDMLEVLGGAIIEGDKATSIFKTLTVAIEELIESGQLQLWVEDIKDAFTNLIPVVSKVANFFLGVKDKIQKVAAFAGSVAGSQGTFQERLTEAFQASIEVPQEIERERRDKLEGIKAKIRNKMERDAARRAGAIAQSSAAAVITKSESAATEAAMAKAAATASGGRAAGAVEAVSLSEIFTKQFGDITPGKPELGSQANPIYTIETNPPVIE